MNIKDITTSISEAENIPAGKVRKITRALLERMGEAIDNGEKLQLPGLVFSPRTLPAREADGDTVDGVFQQDVRFRRLLRNLLGLPASQGA